MYITGIVVVILLLGLDQLAKFLAVKYLMPIGSFPIIEGVFELFYTTNDGAAFSILRGFRWGFVAIAVIIIAAITYYYIKMPLTKQYNRARVCLMFIVAGALGNGLDRAIHGEVVDFFYFKLINFAIFNVADIFVVCGCAVLAVLLLFFWPEGEK